jgi:hypothetical protein
MPFKTSNIQKSFIFLPCQFFSSKSFNYIIKDANIFHFKLGGSCKINYFLISTCYNLSLGLTTKVRACKVASQEGSLRVTSYAFGNAKECEGMNLHTPKWTPILGVGVQWTPEFSEDNYKGQNPLD